ncbi:proline racemase family protein [Aliikangiella sp. IMCC44653]
MQSISQLKIIDSHTGGEPTRTIVEGAPDLGGGLVSQQAAVLASEFDFIRRAIMLEPRGAETMVGALLVKPKNKACAAGVIFFNNVGYLGMCGHGTIGVAVTLYYLGKIGLGMHVFETPVGEVKVNLLSPNRVEVENVASYRYAKGVEVTLPPAARFDDPKGSKVVGDIAWGGNWFFLIKQHGMQLAESNSEQLLEYCWRVRQALESAGISAENGALIDHVELFGAPADPALAESMNFVMCPGKVFDRSPCGTGTSAKLACLIADGIIQPGEVWRQQSIIGSIFEGRVKLIDGQVIPLISGEAYISQEVRIIDNPHDKFNFGFAASAII